MRSAPDVSEKLMPRLTELEEAVTTPCIPGEMAAWLKRVREAAESIRRLSEALEQRAKSLSKEIGAADMEMTQQASEVETGQREALSELDSYCQWLESLEAKEDLEKSGFEYSLLIPQIVKRGEELALAFRRNENAARTWLMEAFERDRGDVD